MGIIRKKASVLAQKTVDIFANTLIIKTFNQFSKFNAAFEEKFNSVFSTSLKIRKFSTINLSLVDITNSITFIVLLILSLNYVIENSMSYGALIAVLSYFPMLFKPVEDFHNLISLFNSIEISINRINGVTERSRTGMTGHEFLQDINTIQFDNVSFQYDDSGNCENRTRLNTIIGKNDIAGVVGMSGAGKSTLIKILMRELDTNDGSVKINDTDLTEFSVQSYFKNVNIFTQNIEIFDEDLQFNLTFNKKIVPKSQKQNILNRIRNNSAQLVEKLIDIWSSKELSCRKKHRKVMKILNNSEIGNELLSMFNLTSDDIRENAQLLDILMEGISADNIEINVADYCFSKNFVLKEKYEEVIENLNLAALSERKLGADGAFVSGGEKQKIAFGRFLLKEGYDFFILDEPFTNLDSINENKLLSFAKQKLEGKTGLIISHKFNILTLLTDRLIVIDNDSSVTEGKHESFPPSNLLLYT